MKANYHLLNRLRVQPTEGEAAIIDYLLTHLDESYELFFNPYLDGDRPDLIILKPNVGAFIIEVKDWDLSAYDIDENNKWHVSHNNSAIKSPHAQAYGYKKNLYDLHLPILGIKELSNKNFFNVVHCFVYLHKSSEAQIKNKYSVLEECISKLKNEEHQKLSKNKSYYDAYQKRLDYLNKKASQVRRDKSLTFGNDQLPLLTRKIKSQGKHILFTEEIYFDFTRRLKPSKNTEDQGKKTNFDKNQSLHLISSPGKRKIKGIAGCGKTSIMAQLAINANERHKSTTLILTFNITLKNLIRDKISSYQGSRNFKDFEISNYHQFFLSQANNLGISISSLDDFDRDIFSENDAVKYSSILLDEIQDYKPEWIKIVRDNFLAENGEMVFFGDHSQNIYGRDEGRASSIIHGFGRWQKLNQSYRITKNSPLNSLFEKFQRNFLLEKYSDTELFSSSHEQSSFDFAISDIIEYNKITLVNDYQPLFQEISNKIKKHELHPNDIVILSAKIDTIRQLNECWCKIEKTHIMFENMDELSNLTNTPKAKLANMLAKDIQKLITQNKDEVEKARRRKKNHFHQNSGLIKLSTVHSFKGLESKSVFYILDQDDSAEIVFTGITRAINNLFIFDISNNSQYSTFFEKI